MPYKLTVESFVRVKESIFVSYPILVLVYATNVVLPFLIVAVIG